MPVWVCHVYRVCHLCRCGMAVDVRSGMDWNRAGRYSMRWRTVVTKFIHEYYVSTIKVSLVHIK